MTHASKPVQGVRFVQFVGEQRRERRVEIHCKRLEEATLKEKVERVSGTKLPFLFPKGGEEHCSHRHVGSYKGV